MRVRHGLHADAVLGFRPVRDIDGERTWLGPWCAVEADAQAVADAAALAFRQAAEAFDIGIVDNDTPTLGLWLPAPENP